jgi:hypothetical protein
MPHKDQKTKAERQKGYAKTYYEKNKETVKATSKKNAKTYKDKWRSFKATLSCVQCGQNHVATLDFHHVDSSTKEGSVNQLAKNRAYKRAMEEVEKCIVLCANCHRIHHYEERLAAKNKKKKGTEAP